MNKETAVKLLKKIKSIAGEASLTGSMSDGSVMLKETYNNIRSAAITENWVDAPELIPEMTDELLNKDVEHMDVIGTAAALLLALLE